MTLPDASLFLRRSLMANAVFSGFSGLVFVLAAGPIARSIGLDDPITLVVVGASLLLYGLGLAHNARRPVVNLIETRVAIALDGLWVVGSAVLVLAGLLNATGNWGAVILADFVLAFAICQFIGLRRVERARLAS
jgi:hypothetical protein